MRKADRGHAISEQPPIGAHAASCVEKIPEPFTVEHFRAWTAELTLDNGQPFILEPFQEAFVADWLAGFPVLWLVLPEASGKTTLLAAIALYAAEHKPHASIPVAAASKEQAAHLYQQAERFILQTPRLHETVHSDLQAAKGKLKTDVPRFTALEGFRRINHVDGARVQIFPAEDRTGDGVLPDLAIIDELHRHRDLRLLRTWVGKLGKKSGQAIVISTAGEAGSEFEETRDAMRASATDVQQDGAFGRYAGPDAVLHEWALEDGADPDDMEAVKRANPLRAVTVEALQAKHDLPTMTAQHWLRFVANRASRPEESAITAAEWEAQAVAGGIPAGQPIRLGVDIGWRWDPTAMVPYWVRDPNYRLLGPATIITPPRDGSSTHPDSIRAALATINARNPIEAVILDPSDAVDIAAWIRDDLGIPTVEVPQTNSNHVKAYAAFTEGLRNQYLHHSGDPGLTRHVLNAISKMLPGGEVKFERPSQSRRAMQEQRVIDALVAAAMVVAFSDDAKPKKRPSKYNDPNSKGLVVV